MDPNNNGICTAEPIRAPTDRIQTPDPSSAARFMRRTRHTVRMAKNSKQRTPQAASRTGYQRSEFSLSNPKRTPSAAAKSQTVVVPMHRNKMYATCQKESIDNDNHYISLHSDDSPVLLMVYWPLAGLLLSLSHETSE